jgi:uncharacterized protein YegP (UPF0339 family)
MHMHKRTARFHIRKTRNGQYLPYLKAANGEQVAGSETYKTQQGAERWLERIRDWVGDASVRGVIIDKPTTKEK